MGVIVKQQIIEVYIAWALAILAICVCVLTFRPIKNCVIEHQKNNDDISILWIVWVAIVGITFGGVVASILKSGALFNPEYYALKDIASILMGK